MIEAIELVEKIVEERIVVEEMLVKLVEEAIKGGLVAVMSTKDEADDNVEMEAGASEGVKKDDEEKAVEKMVVEMEELDSGFSKEEVVVEMEELDSEFSKE